MDELMQKNSKKVWTTISTRIPQEKKANILKAADAIGMNLNQFIAKLIADYVEDGSRVDDRRIADKLFDLMYDLKQRVIRLEGQKAALEIELRKRKIRLKELPTDTPLSFTRRVAEERMEKELDEEIKRTLRSD